MNIIIRIQAKLAKGVQAKFKLIFYTLWLLKVEDEILLVKNAWCKNSTYCFKVKKYTVDIFNNFCKSSNMFLEKAATYNTLRNGNLVKLITKPIYDQFMSFEYIKIQYVNNKIRY